MSDSSGLENWDGKRVLALRRALGLTQQEFSRALGTRQQTISEWERGRYRPRGTAARLLSLVAERAGFRYGEGNDAEALSLAPLAPSVPGRQPYRRRRVRKRPRAS